MFIYFVWSIWCIVHVQKSNLSIETHRNIIFKKARLDNEVKQSLEKHMEAQHSIARHKKSHKHFYLLIVSK